MDAPGAGGWLCCIRALSRTPAFLCVAIAFAAAVAIAFMPLERKRCDQQHADGVAQGLAAGRFP